MSAFRGFFSLLARVPRWRIILLFLLMVATAATEGIGFLLLVPMLGLLAAPDSLGGLPRQIGEVLQRADIAFSVEGLLAIFLVLIALRSALQFAREQMSQKIERHLVDGYRHEAFALLLGSEWRWLAQRRRSDYASLLLNDIDRVGLAMRYGVDLAATLTTLAIYLVVALKLSALATGLVIASGAVMYLALLRLRRRAVALGQEQTAASESIFANVQESLAGIKLAKLLGTEKRHLSQFDASLRRMRGQYLAYTASTNLAHAVFQVGIAVLLVLYLYAGLNYFRLGVPELLALSALFARFVPMMVGSMQSFYQLGHAVPAFENAESLLADCRLAAEPAVAVPAAPRSLDSGIRLEGVSYTYAGRRARALADVTLTFPARTTTAIIGASGSGKSTLADLLIGLIAPDRGELAIDGIPLAGEGRMHWRASVAYVPQEVFLFNDSIRNNLLWGRPEAGEAEIGEALALAAADFVHDLPEGLATVVGDAGVRLSGGERQRLALARALLRRPSLLILDEATSALDVENELRIRDAIEGLHGDLTMVIIGHRLPTLEHADQVVRLAAGRVAAVGSWSDLRGGSDDITT